MPYNNPNAGAQLMNNAQSTAAEINGTNPTVTGAESVLEKSVDPETHIIVIPGISGSEMQDDTNKNKLWFSPWESTVAKMKMDKDGKSINKVSAIQEGYGANDTYKDLIVGLKKEFGEKKVHYFAYDWRIDNAITAGLLEKFIEDIRKGYKTKPNIDIVAHSMGGLVASRYVANGHSKIIRKLITLGTPYLGSPKVPYIFSSGRLIVVFGFPVASGGIKKIAPHMTTAYQLLPYDNADGYIAIWDGEWHNRKSNINNYKYVADEHDFIKNNLKLVDADGGVVTSVVKENFLNTSKNFMKTIFPNNTPAINAVDSYLIIGIGKDTIYTTGYDKNNEHIHNFEFTTGDGTVPAWSAKIEGKTIKSESLKWYAYKYDHTKLAQESEVLKDVILLLKNQEPTNCASKYNDEAQSNTGSGNTVVHVDCPVDISVTRHGETLCNAGEHKNTDADFGTLYLVGENEDVKIMALHGDDPYDVMLQGTDVGTMDYNIRFYDSDYNLLEKRIFQDIAVTASTRIKTNTDREKTTLLVDNKGTGDYSQAITPNACIQYYSLTISAGKGGAISEGKSKNYVSDSIILIAATPDKGYLFKNWISSGGGAFEDANSASTTYTMPANATTITATFESFDKTFSSELGTWNNPFSDINEKDLFYDAIKFVSTAGLFTGISTTNFSPKSIMTRAMFAQALANLEQTELSFFKSSRYKDVPEGKVYTGAVEWVAQEGIAPSSENSMFNSEAGITCKQMEFMLSTYAHHKGIPHSHNIVANIFNGYVSDSTITRAEAAEVFLRFCKIMNG